MLSSGAKKDLLVLYFAYSLIKVSKDSNEYDGIEAISNKDYKINKRIDRNLDKLENDILKTIDSLIGEVETAKWIKNNLDKRVGKLLMKIQDETINLEFLALWVLYVNFADNRTQKLNDEFSWLTNENLYFRVAEYLSKTNVAKVEDKMFMMAYDAVHMIKT